MRVMKRSSEFEEVSFDKVLRRISKLSTGIDVNFHEVAQKVCSRIYDGVHTDQLDELAGNICSSLIVDNPDYDTLAARIAISNHHKKTYNTFTETIEKLYSNPGNQLISDEVYNVAMANKEKLNAAVDYERDYLFDYFGFKTLEKSYLLSSNNNANPIERPQDMWMRVSLGIHGTDIDRAIETYTLMSLKMFTHATPTLFNFGTKREQGSSCFLISMESDSVDGMYNTLRECAMISKYAGGIGVHIHNVRANGSIIRGTNGKSTGIVPMLRVYNDCARHINQAGKRNGSFAIYIEPWHADIFAFLDLKKNHGNEAERARDLFYALWIPDLFMRRVRENGKWSLMCPNQCTGLSDAFDDSSCDNKKFTELYQQYEKEGKFVKQVQAQDVWFKILESQIETGTPYMLYKDAVNSKTNHKNLGTIKSSNLCSEIVQYTSPEEIAVCNLASICLPSYIVTHLHGEISELYFDFEQLRKNVGVVTRNLNKIIDKNFYPVEKAKISNLRHRPIGIGVQGLADTFLKLDLAYDSEEAKILNRQIFETIYYGALQMSCELAMAAGSYETFAGSPMSKGILQYDMWGVKPSDLWNWDELKSLILKHGVRNSLLVAPMPTASTSQIMGNTEAFEPITSNIYKRKTLAGEFILVNKFLVKELQKIGMWSSDMKEKIIANDGSIQNLEGIPSEIANKYKTVWEIKQKDIIDMAADRGAFVDQSQSMNLYQSSPTFSKLTNMHFYAWEKELKTGIYYLRSKAKAATQKFSINSEKTKANYEAEAEPCLECSA